ncbi:hypothetical protein [Paludisphaera soli]|uniref:hypothetical protein n=1 Tax=Paludisphaera soli TaxID=2712865 RepID=UPI0013EA5E2C|nr:hypothetical protein [Paludisphaera soli]
MKRMLLDRLIADYPETPAARPLSARSPSWNSWASSSTLKFDDEASGRSSAIADLKGRVVVLDFQAT